MITPETMIIPDEDLTQNMGWFVINSWLIL